MAAFLIAPLYILVNWYILRLLLRWAGSCCVLFQSTAAQAILVILYLFCASSLLTGFLIRRPRALHRLLKNTGDYFLGALPYILLTIFPVNFAGYILKNVYPLSASELHILFVLAGFICLSLILFISLYGAVHVRTIRVSPYEVHITKKTEDMTSLKIVLLADLHLGSQNSRRFLRRLVKLVNAQNPDLICIAGDLFDNDYDAIRTPAQLSSIMRELRAKYGVYACWGNHDLNEPILAGFTFHRRKKGSADPRMEEWLKASGIRLLEDEVCLINGKFYLIGRSDPERAVKLGVHRPSPASLVQNVDKSKPIIFLDHQPKELPEIALAGVDLDLSGHTHNGQLFPGNLLLRFFWKNPFGHLYQGSLHSIVTSGAGVWGPQMRVGTNSEICTITVHFN